MPPPPVTPSPHRFIVKKEAPIRKTPLSQAYTPRPSTQPQFNATPRFTFSSTPRPTQGNHPAPTSGPASSAARFSTPRPTRAEEKTDDVVEHSSDDIPSHVRTSIEIKVGEEDFQYGSAEEDGYRIEEEQTPKRRRVTSPLLDDEPDLLASIERQDEEEQQQKEDLSSSIPTLSSPPAPPRRIISSAHPKFLPSTPFPSSTPLEKEKEPQTFLKPPRFRPPDPTETSQSTSDPLPEQFSPHRKGQKYVSGGLAAEVRDWLVNLESSVSSSSSKRTYAGDEAWVVKVLVDEVSGGGRAGMTLVRGRQVHDTGDGEGMVDYLGEVRVMLAGEGQGTGVQKGSKVDVGKVVGIKSPVWEVCVDGCKWGVGVDWKVLN